MEINNMTPENFCYWLQGWIELQNPKEINETQIEEIKNHLNLVFDKVTPNLQFKLSPDFNQGQLWCGNIPVNTDNTKFVAITC